MPRTKKPPRLSEADASENLERLMIESGERDRLRDKLRRHLDDCGWREQVKLYVRETAAEKGRDHKGDILMEDLVQEVVPKANDMVPDKIRRDLAASVQKFLERHAAQE